ncbi:MAG TPA: hypothetical protein ENN25_06650 [Euryarchaeota archaeon]|nr:hypothetical protein [Euryarchaeota archaeon]
MSNNHEMPDAKQLKEILGTISEEIPKILESVSKALYGSENAEKLGKTVAQFYKELIEAGMTPEQAYKLTRDYMAGFSLGGMLASAVKAGRGDNED